jgi:hypothetical protein
MVFADKAMPRMGRGAVSETYVCVAVLMMPTASPAQILLARNCAGVAATHATATPAAAIAMPAANSTRRPSASCTQPAARAPSMLMTLYTATKGVSNCYLR